MKRLIAALLLTATPAMAFDIGAMSEDEKAAFGQAVREYLMANPEVLVESINVLEERRVATEAQNDVTLVASNHDAIFNDGHSWIGGNPEGDVTMVEFIDYRCGYCRKFNDQVHDIVKDDGNIRLILKEFPILGPESETSARFAVAVKQVGGDEAYVQAHEALMALRGAPSPEALREIASDIGLEPDEVMNTMNAESVTAVLRDNRQLAERMAIMGTPTFVIGDTLLRGMPAEGLEPSVAAAREGKG
ncbi:MULTISPECIES: DsbA family protein [Paracoccus]|uniref:DsbA family protein n=1 Tax=Paracoccus fontiphilus TaxID=1815556 RepID=A0ABV7IFA2_9RHOB|nr:DsbA family protein [Paracoccus fontiphilus]